MERRVQSDDCHAISIKRGSICFWNWMNSLPRELTLIDASADRSTHCLAMIIRRELRPVFPRAHCYSPCYLL